MKFSFSLLFLALTSFCYNQTGGSYSFPFLNLDYNARIAATGGYFVTVQDDDLNLATANPSFLNSQMNNAVVFNQAFLAGGVNYGMAAYAHKGLKGMCSANVKYVDYGTFQRTESNGQASGTFRPFEYVVGLAYAKQLNPLISVGGGLNFIGSILETYSAYGISLDLGGTYKHPNNLFTASALFKNVGLKVKNYTSNDTGNLPGDFQIGASYKLAHAPFRFNAVVHNLNRWDLTYNDPFLQPTYDALTGDTIPVPRANFIEKTARHLLVSTELLLSKSLTFRMGFNYQRRQEMKLVERPGLSGMSLGLGFKSKRFRIDYGFVMYSKAGYNHVVSLSSSIDSWKKK